MSSHQTVSPTIGFYLFVAFQTVQNTVSISYRFSPVFLICWMTYSLLNLLEHDSFICPSCLGSLFYCSKINDLVVEMLCTSKESREFGCLLIFSFFFFHFSFLLIYVGSFYICVYDYLSSICVCACVYACVFIGVWMHMCMQISMHLYHLCVKSPVLIVNILNLY